MSSATFRKYWLPWTFVGLLTTLCATLAVVQSGWINEISNAERNRLQTAFQADLNRLGKDFDGQIAEAFTELKPSFAEITEWGVITACARQYRQCCLSQDLPFRRVGVVSLESTEPLLFLMELNTGQLAPSAWPREWQGLRQRFRARLSDAVLPQLPDTETLLLESPLYGSMHKEPAGNTTSPSITPPFLKEDWLIAELSQDYVASSMLPSLVQRYISGAGMPSYDLSLTTTGKPSHQVLRLGAEADHGRKPDASVDLLDLDKMQAFRSQGPPLPGDTQRISGTNKDYNNARWRLSVYHRGFALEDQVTVARWRNLSLSGGILLLILATVLVLLQNARRSQQLATMQMNFVAGVSHELRTPLAVIRTAAFNLRGRLATRPEQVEKYGSLIQKETEMLSVVVEQVLRYGAAGAGRVIGERQRLSADRLIQGILASGFAASGISHSGLNLTIEKNVASELPMIVADELALRHAIQNLMDNAIKYGTEGSAWIGISAQPVEEHGKTFVEIRVADHGPGIPRDEQPHLFDAFFRGRRALQDQMHGTGLGLNLVKSIVEAHGGTIGVTSQPGEGAEFIVRLPAAREEFQDVFSNSSG